jgi:hypothetical protein
MREKIKKNFKFSLEYRLVVFTPKLPLNGTFLNYNKNILKLQVLRVLLVK